MKTIIRIVAPVIVIAIGLFAAWRILAARPVAPRRSSPPPLLTIDVRRLKPTDYQVMLRSRGVVRAPTRTQLATEVSGRIIKVAEAFHDGRFFRAGEILVEIDPRDYTLEVQRLEQELVQAKANLSELDAEVAGNARQIKLAQRRADLQRARLDREQNLTRGGFSSEAAREVVEREELDAQTQVEQLKIQNHLLRTRRTRLSSAITLASIRLQQAQLNLERTRIIAPYDGRVRQRAVDVADFVNKGATIASIYAVDRAEVRLPLSDHQLAFLDLPEHHRDGSRGGRQLPIAYLMVRNGLTEHRWQGEVIRSEGAIDASNRQLFVVAEIKDPYGDFQDGRPPLRVGTFVQAEIAGRRLTDVYTAPRSEVQGENEILLVDKAERRMRRHAVEVLWRDEQVVVFHDATLEGKYICTTPVVFAGDAVKVRIRGDGEGRVKRPKRKEAKR